MYSSIATVCLATEGRRNQDRTDVMRTMCLVRPSVRDQASDKFLLIVAVLAFLCGKKETYMSEKLLKKLQELIKTKVVIFA